MEGTTTLGSASVTGGTATFTTSGLSIGGHSLNATFVPADPTDVSGSTSAAVSLNIVPATTTALTVPGSSVDFGAPVTLTGAVNPSNAAGSIKFFDGASVLGTVPVAAGAASLTTSSLDSGVHSLTAEFVPSDATAFGPSTSSPQSLTVKPQASSLSLAVSPSSSPVVQGTSVSITATMTPTAATGTVTFSDNGTALLTHAVSAGTATFTSTTFKVGDHSFSASFTPADATKFTASSSTTPATFTVVPKPTVTDCTDSTGNVIKSGADLKPGAKFTVHASGFVPGEDVTAELHSTPITLGTFTASQTGTVAVPVTLPANIAAGFHQVIISGQRGSAVFTFKVASSAKQATTPPSTTSNTPSTGVTAPVPNTGAVVKPGLFVGIGAILIGFALIGYARPRRRRS